MAALKNLAASMPSGGDPTDILELVGADKYWITDNSNSADPTYFALPDDRDLTDNKQIKLVLLFGPSLQTTGPSSEFGVLAFFVQYQYSEGAYIHFYINDANTPSYYQNAYEPSFRTDGSSPALGNGPTRLLLNSTLGSNEVNLKSGAKALIFYMLP